MLLVHKKLWKGVTEPEADADRSAEAKALIGLNVTEQYLGCVVVARNAKQAWDEPVAKYVGRTKDLERELLAAGAEVKPEDLAMSVITGLSKEIDTLVTVLVAANAVKSIDEMLPQLQIHE